MHYLKETFDHHTQYFEPLRNKSAGKEFIYHRQIEISTNTTQTLFHFHVPVKISPLHGLALLVIQDPLAQDSVKSFIIETSFILSKDIPFNILSLTQNAKVDLATHTKEDPINIKLEQAITARTYAPLFQINRILSATTLSYQEEYDGDFMAQDHVEILIIESGQLELTVNYRQHLLDKGKIFIIPPKQTSKRYHSANHHSKIHSIRLEVDTLPKELMLQEIEGGSLIGPIIDLMYLNRPSNLIANRFLTEFNHLLTQLLARQQSQEDLKATLPMRDRYENELFSEIIQYIHESDQVDIKVSDLVSQFNISRSTLQQLFNKFEHTTPKLYINQIRLEKSRQLIRESNMSITEIASLLGYGSIQYFSRAFSKQYNMSPSEYAKGYSKRL